MAMKKMIFMWMAAMVISASAETFDTEDYFSITLPSEWVRMPDDALVSFTETVGESSPDTSEGIVYDYGFQKATDGQWLSYPCILVEVRNIGRFSTGDLERFAEQSAGDDTQLNEDKALFLEIREKDGINILVARQLTERGFIQLSGFAPVDTFDQYEPVFRDAFANLKIDEAIQYKPQITDHAPVVGNVNLGKVFIVCVQAALVGGIMWVVYTLVRRKLKRA